MPSISLFQPLPGLPLHLWLLWPLIYWRIRRLKAWFRENGAPGSQMLWGVTRDGRVVINLLSDDLSGHKPPQSGFGFQPSRRFREAAYGEVLILTAARYPGLRRECGNAFLLPLPET